MFQFIHVFLLSPLMGKGESRTLENTETSKEKKIEGSQKKLRER